MTRRSALLIAAIVIAAVGTMLVYLYVKSVQDTAYADQQPVTVLVAKQAVDVGTSGSAAVSSGAFEEKVLPQDAVPADALSNPSGVATNVAVTTILPGQVVQKSMFGQRAVNGQLPLEKGTMALSVELGDPERVAGFVQPGSRVAVFATIEGDNGPQATKLLLSGVDVAAVGPTTAVEKPSSEEGEGQSESDQVTTAILTLALTQKQAEKVVFAQETGQLYFALLNESSEVAASGGVSSGNLFD